MSKENKNFQVNFLFRSQFGAMISRRINESTTALITDLIPATRYNLTVIPLNKNDLQGFESEVLEVITSECSLGQQENCFGLRKITANLSLRL